MFKKNDIVKCSVLGVGCVVKVSSSKSQRFPVQVKFDSQQSIKTFTIVGSSWEGSEITLTKIEV